MSDLNWNLALIVVLPPTLIALCVLALVWRIGVSINQLHLTFNSKMDRLLASTQQLAYMEGRRDEKAHPNE